MIVRLFRSEPASGIVLFVACIAALIVANSGLESWYHSLLDTQLGFMHLHGWIDDGLMTIFFLLVGLEIKRELVEGRLSTPRSRIVPGIAAAMGMVVPALLFVVWNLQDSSHLRGWAIPTATDIAFSVGVLSLLGSRVPVSLRVLLVSIAVFDDLGAVVVIAIFYTSNISILWLIGALLTWCLCLVFMRTGVRQLWPYLSAGVLLWICLYHSGVHPTLAGVLVALSIPSRAIGYSPVQVLEHRLDTWVGFVVVPLFGFANAGLVLNTLSTDDLTGGITIGVVSGLVFGKQIGIFGAIWMLDRVGWVRKASDISWHQIHAIAMLCGIGFTMSLFIAGLSYADAPHLIEATKLGVLGGSLVSAVAGFALLKRATPQNSASSSA